jgi:hypothetical protein
MFHVRPSNRKTGGCREPLEHFAPPAALRLTLKQITPSAEYH